MNTALIVGGGSGLGHALARRLRERGYGKIYILDRKAPDTDSPAFVYHRLDLAQDRLDTLSGFDDVDTLIVTAGIGRLAPFSTFTPVEIQKTFQINAVSAVQLLGRFYGKLRGRENFHCAVLSSISGLITSPLFSLYAATKAAVARFAESVNIELEKEGSPNRVLNVCPGVLEGTSFYGGASDFDGLAPLADEILDRMERRETLFIPKYDEVYRDVIRRYQDDPRGFGLDSYDHKQKSGRVNMTPRITTGYLSGTFDLFHIGHLNILRRAKEHCDYLVVGVHQDASHKGKETFIPFDERRDIVGSVRYVDEVVRSKPEDMDMWEDLKYDFLFVGSDYQGTERFNRYEAFFKDKNVRIVYLPYTRHTSSTQLRSLIDRSIAGSRKDGRHDPS